jgi:dTDP-4-amino-4,6-dideoxygalactose transaminase
LSLTVATKVEIKTPSPMMALRAVGVGQGDEVLVPAMTAVATWMAVSQIGAVPVGVDIEPLRNGIDPAGVRARLTPRTEALVAVHLFGHPADVASLAALAAEANIPLVEDAAQAHGAYFNRRPVGSLGALAAFSFYPTKNLGAMGDAGAVTTSDPGLADRVTLLREYGWRSRGDAELRGVNARLDELQAALLRVMLGRLRDATARRQAIAQAYLAGLAAFQGWSCRRPQRTASRFGISLSSVTRGAMPSPGRLRRLASAPGCTIGRCRRSTPPLPPSEWRRGRFRWQSVTRHTL